MKHLMKAMLVVGVLGTVAACTNPPGRFDNPPGAGGAGVVPGSASDPTSPAYFQQTVGDRVLFAIDQSTCRAKPRRCWRCRPPG